MDKKFIRIIGNDTEADRLLAKHFTPYMHKAFIEIGEDKHCMSISYMDWAEKLSKFQVRDDDIFVVGFPRTGTTWLSEMVWLIANDLDYNGAQEKIMLRVPVLEVDTFFDSSRASSLNTILFNGNDLVTYIDKLIGQRCIKSHLHWTLLPEEITNGTKQPKMICLLRNPKDTCISYYNLHKLFLEYKGSFEDFCTLFLEGRVIATPFWKHVLSYWKQRHRPNILFITYKHMKEDITTVIKQVAEFIGKQLTEIQIEQLISHINIENMRRNTSVNHDVAVEGFAKLHKLHTSDKNNYIGAGVQGGYADIMSPELIERFDEWSKEQLSETDLIVE